MNISIIIPILNEAGKIEADIKQAIAFFTRNSLTGEIIIVDDGSTDNSAKTAQKVLSNLPAAINGKVITYQPNRGKGYAVKTGIQSSAGRYVAFIDSGNCMNYDSILYGIDMIKENSSDIAHASRNLPSSRIIRQKSLYRKICSRLFQFFIKLYFSIPKELTDTQCGLKIYSGDIARKLYQNAATDGFMFDIEIILRAIKANYRIKEFPIDWTCDTDSRLTPAKSIFRISKEFRDIKRKLC